MEVTNQLHNGIVYRSDFSYCFSLGIKLIQYIDDMCFNILV